MKFKVKSTRSNLGDVSNTKRLGFIDAGRSIAIIMMLQGHFVSMTFKNYLPMEQACRTSGFSGSYFFDIWVRLRGFTAPLFFTITGVVFVYLLTKKTEDPFWRQVRVKKGIKRGLFVIFWGYLLQLNYRSIDIYMAGRVNSRFYLFHVLQSIGVGILVLVLIYGLARLIKIKRLHIVLTICTLLIFYITPFVRGTEGYFPKGVHEVIQNMFNGPNSGFSLFPWLGYVMFGGAYRGLSSP